MTASELAGDSQVTRRFSCALILREILVRQSITVVWNIKDVERRLTLGSVTYKPLTPLIVAVVVGPLTGGDTVKI